MKKIRFNWKYTVYIMVGIILALLTGFTGKMDLSQTDRDIYKKAMELESTVNGLGFNDFDVTGYKVRFFDGDNDYVVQGTNVEKEKPVMDTFVGTTVEVQGEFQVLLPTYDKFSQMFNALTAVGNVAEGNLAFDESSYTRNSHIATLWHEAFHTWQFNNSMENIERQALAAGITEQTSYSEIILNEVDENEEIVLLYEECVKLLTLILETDSAAEKNSLLAQYQDLYEKRESMLGKEAAYIEQYYETIEGTARYVEACIFRELEGDAAWRDTYMQPFAYQKGSGKYYDSGMLKCMILDELYPEWKEDFEASKNINDILFKMIK